MERFHDFEFNNRWYEAEVTKDKRENKIEIGIKECEYGACLDATIDRDKVINVISTKVYFIDLSEIELYAEAMKAAWHFAEQIKGDI